MIEVKATCSDGALEHAVNEDIAHFEEWFRGLKNDPLVRSEVAILKTYLFWKVKGDSDAKRSR